MTKSELNQLITETLSIDAYKSNDDELPISDSAIMIILREFFSDEYEPLTYQIDAPDSIGVNFSKNRFEVNLYFVISQFNSWYLSGQLLEKLDELKSKLQHSFENPNLN